MAEPKAPKVKLPDAMPSRPVVPGANSWAQQQQQQQLRNPPVSPTSYAEPTNRDKYENKPMPLPPPSEDDAFHATYTLKPRTYVQPAVPKLTSLPHVPNAKNRAVTDPITPKPLFSEGKTKLNKLRKQLSLSKGKGGSLKEGSIDDSEATTGIHVTSEKATQIEGVNQKPTSNYNTTPTSASYTSGLDLRQTSDEHSQETATPAQQIQPSPAPTRSTPVPTRNTPALTRRTPVPTRRYLEENPGLTSGEAFSMRQTSADQRNQGEVKEPNMLQEHQPSDGPLHHARMGTHTNVGEVGLVEGAGMHRIESFRGVIEDAPPSDGSSARMYTEPYANVSQPSAGRGQDFGGRVPPSAYSPSNYGGVWENDPAVGRTLPPFTPGPKGPSSTGGTASHYNSPFAQQYPASNDNHGRGSYPINSSSSYQHPLPSANSWASNNSQGNSFAHSNAPTSALLPPRWRPHQQYTNSVPSPPANVQDFQRAGSLSAAMAHMDLSMHHHIDSSFASLSRQITDKHDQTVDQTIRRLDKMDNTLKKGFKDIKNELRDIKNIVGSTQQDAKMHHNVTIGYIGGLTVKLQSLEKRVEEHISAIEAENDRHHRSETTSQTSRRRTESARPTFGPGESRRQDQGEVSRSSNNSQVGGTNSRRDRSNAPRPQQPAGRVSEGSGNRREYFTELGAAMGPQPDLRNHPAYADQQQTQGQSYKYGHDENGDPAVLEQLPFQIPSLTDGKWFDEAYGRR